MLSKGGSCFHHTGMLLTLGEHSKFVSSPKTVLYLIARSSEIAMEDGRTRCIVFSQRKLKSDLLYNMFESSRLVCKSCNYEACQLDTRHYE